MMWEPKEVNCLQCGNRIMQRTSRQRFCSDKCYFQSYEDDRPEFIPEDAPFMERKDIARHLGITRSGVEQIEVKALHRLRMRGVNMRDFL